MFTVDPRLERIAARLTSAQLRADADDDDGDVLAAGNAFVDAYSTAGLKRALDEYGVTKALEDRGLADHDVVITREDAFRHRLRLVLKDGPPIMDLRLHLVDAAGASIVVVDWLLMQNPRASFTPKKPQLPGQEHPGAGMGAQVHQLLVLLCRRLGRDALVTVPERFHLAALYRRAGYVGAVDDDANVNGVLAAGDRAGVSFAALAWAVERGFVKDADGAVYVHAPRELFFPLSKRLRRAVDHDVVKGKDGFVVDKDGLDASLIASPVAGLASSA